MNDIKRVTASDSTPEERRRFKLIMAPSDDADSQYELGLAYLEGRLGLPRWNRQAVFRLEQATEHGHDLAPQCLAYMYYTGTCGLPRNLPRAAGFYRLSADRGVAQAQYMLGYMYEKGKGVQKDLEEAAKYLWLAANQGLVEAEERVAKIQRHVRFVPQDPEAVARYYKIAADRGYAHAQFQRSLLFSEGRGEMRSSTQTAFYCGLAAKNGHPLACLTMAHFHFVGKIVKQDHKAASEYYLRASSGEYSENELIMSSSPEVQCSVAGLFMAGAGLKKNTGKSIEIYRLSASQGYPEAQFQLGSIFRLGHGIDQCNRTAAEYFKLAADKGHAEAQFQIAEMLKKGLGIPQDLTLAFQYYQKAKYQGVTRSSQTFVDDRRGVKRDRVGNERNSQLQDDRRPVLCESSSSVERSYYVPLQYFRSAATKGDLDAFYDVGRVLEFGWFARADGAAACRYYELGAHNSHDQAHKAQRSLGFNYDHGRGIPPDLEKAARYYDLAAAQNDHIAISLRATMIHRIQLPLLSNKEYLRLYFDSGFKKSLVGRAFLGRMLLSSSEFNQDLYEEGLRYCRSVRENGFGCVRGFFAEYE